MKISSVNFLRLSLLLPYIFAAILHGLSLMVDPTMDPDSSLSAVQIIKGIISGIIMLTSIVYLFGAIYWITPYSTLMIIFWIWSKNKTPKQMYKLLIWSPLILAISIPIFAGVMSHLNWLPQFHLDDISGLGVVAFPFSLFFGYVLISISAYLYGFLKSRNIIVDEENYLK